MNEQIWFCPRVRIESDEAHLLEAFTKGLDFSQLNALVLTFEDWKPASQG